MVDQSSRPAALDNFRRTLVQQFQPDRAAEFARSIGGAGARSLDEQVTCFIQHGGGQGHLRAIDSRKSRDRRIAMAVENPQHFAFGIRASVRGKIIDPQGREIPQAAAPPIPACASSTIWKCSGFPTEAKSAPRTR